MGQPSGAGLVRLGDAFNPDAKKLTQRKGRKRAPPFVLSQAFVHHPPPSTKADPKKP